MNKFFLSLTLTLATVLSAGAWLTPQQRMEQKLRHAADNMMYQTSRHDGNADQQLSLTKLNGPQKVFNSISDLYGTWMVNYSDGSQQYFTITISAGLGTGKVKISGWWVGSLATDINATVSLAGGTGKLTIAANQLVVNVDGYDQGYLVNTANTASDIVFNIYSSGMSTSTKWGIQTSSGGYYTYSTGLTMCKKCNGTMRYTFDNNTYSDPVLMGQNSAMHESRLTIFNFFGLGTMQNDWVVMKSDSTFEIPPVLLYTDSESGGRYYNYGTDGTNRWNITGKGNELQLKFGTSWSLCSPGTDEWMGEISNTIIFYTDDSKFLYPLPTPEAITLSLTDADEQVVEPGSTYQLYATITPAGADQSVTWSSSDETVATVDANGLVTALPQTQSAAARAPRLEGGGKVVTITATSVAAPTLSASVKLYVGYPVSDDSLFGDLNKDGIVDVADINVLVSVILGKYTR